MKNVYTLSLEHGDIYLGQEVIVPNFKAMDGFYVFGPLVTRKHFPQGFVVRCPTGSLVEYLKVL